MTPPDRWARGVAAPGTGRVERWSEGEGEGRTGWPSLVEETTTALYEDWKRDGRHLAEYASECVETAVSVFCVVGVVSGLMAASSPVAHAIPSVPLRLLIVGLILGGVGWLIALSPPGKLSGAHANPAVSLLGQMAGAAVGAAVGVAAFGHLAAEVAHASLHPSPIAGSAGTVLGEAGATFALTFAVFTCVSHQRLRHWTPAVAMLMVGLLVWGDGNYSGAGMNPARWFGPALTLADWRLAWAYVVGPLLGVATAALLRRTGLFTHPMPHTGKIVHDGRYRSIFTHEAVPSRPPHSVRRRALDVTRAGGATTVARRAPLVE